MARGTVIASVPENPGVLAGVPAGPGYIMHIIPLDTPQGTDVLTLNDRVGGGPLAVPPDPYVRTDIIQAVKLSEFNGGKAAAPLTLKYEGTIEGSTGTAGGSTSKFVLVTETGYAPPV